MDFPLPQVKSVRERLLELVGGAVPSLYRDEWSTFHYDRQLRMPLLNTLLCLGASGIAVSQRDGKLVLYIGNSCCKSVTDEIHAQIKRDVTIVLTQLWRRNADVLSSPPGISSRFSADSHEQPLIGALLAHDGDWRDIDALRVFVMAVARRTSDKAPAVIDRGRSVNLIAMIYRPKDVLDVLRITDSTELTLISEQYRRSAVELVLQLVMDAFRHRDRRFAAFSPEAAQRYWDDSEAIMDQTSAIERSTCLMPPWEYGSHSSRTDSKTATLSIDLRKSTYCMEYTQPKEFGAWLDQLVEKMRSVTHMHGGIFDKFTGDGALVHFLDRDCRAILGIPGVDAAIHCAVDMQRAMEIHMRGLRHILHHDSPLFGAGVAIDVDDAFWSYDHRDNPIVVGKGVVGACRVGDKAPRQSIRLTNGAYWQASPSIRERLNGIRKQPLETKEAAGSLCLECWEFSADRELNVGRGLDVIEKMCRRLMGNNQH